MRLSAATEYDCQNFLIRTGVSLLSRRFVRESYGFVCSRRRSQPGRECFEMLKTFVRLSRLSRMESHCSLTAFVLCRRLRQFPRVLLSRGLSRIGGTGALNEQGTEEPRRGGCFIFRVY